MSDEAAMSLMRSLVDEKCGAMGGVAPALPAANVLQQHARRDSFLSLATGPILLIRSQIDPVTSGVVECRLVVLSRGNAEPSCRPVRLSDIELSGVGLQSGCSSETVSARSLLGRAGLNVSHSLETSCPTLGPTIPAHRPAEASPARLA